MEPNSPAVNPILTNIATQYRNASFIADAIMPSIPVVNKSGRYLAYTKPDRFTVRDTTLAPKAEAKEVEMTASEATYACKGYALKDFVSDDEVNNSPSPLSPQSDTVEFLQDLVQLDREKRVVDLLAANVPGANAGAKWNVAGTDVIGDINTAIANCFAPPNTVIMSYDVLLALDKNTGIMDRIKYSQMGVLTEELLAKLFKVDRVIIGKSKYNTAKRGQTPAYTQVWSDNVYVAYIAPRVTPRTLTLGATFAETLYGSQWWRVRSWREEKRGLGGGNEIQVEASLDEKLIAADVAYAIKDVL
jgi:hypothetical protein